MGEKINIEKIEVYKDTYQVDLRYKESGKSEKVSIRKDALFALITVAEEEATLTSCEWALIDQECASVYNTACGHAWQFAEADIKDCSIEFCPFCGKVIQIDKNEI